MRRVPEPAGAARSDAVLAGATVPHQLQRELDDPDARLRRATALAASGYLDAALLELSKGLEASPAHPALSRLQRELVAQRERRNSTLKGREEVFGWPIREVLGIGWEGAVYRVTVREAQGDQGDWVVKVFHDHVSLDLDRERSALAGPKAQVLRRLASGLRNAAEKPPEHLYPFALVEEDGRVLGLRYRYERLIPLSGHHLRFRRGRLAVISAFLRCQSFLLRAGGLCLTDGSRSNLMVTRGGRLRLIDYGTSIMATDDPHCRQDCWHGAGLICLLCTIWWPEGKQRTVGVTADQLRLTRDLLLGRMPADPVLDPLRRLLQTVTSPASPDPLDYDRASERLPHRIPPSRMALAILSERLSGHRRAALASVRRRIR